MSPEDKGRDQHGPSTTKENQRCPENRQTLEERPGTALRRSQPADSWSQDFQLPEERDNKFLLFYTTRSVVLHCSSSSKWTHTHIHHLPLARRQAAVLTSLLCLYPEFVHSRASHTPFLPSRMQTLLSLPVELQLFSSSKSSWGKAFLRKTSLRKIHFSLDLLQLIIGYHSWCPLTSMISLTV